LYALAGDASKTQFRVRQIASVDYNDTANGLAGVRYYHFLLLRKIATVPFHFFFQNEDCGQMSAWYLFSALGFYPVNPASTEYIVGS
jgi:putative alpha-1,2-mannosidase